MGSAALLVDSHLLQLVGIGLLVKDAAIVNTPDVLLAHHSVLWPD